MADQPEVQNTEVIPDNGLGRRNFDGIQRYKSYRSLFAMALVYSFGMFYCKYSTTYLGVFTED